MAIPSYRMPYDPLSTNAPFNGGGSLPHHGDHLHEPPSSMGKFPHVRAHLSHIARHYKPLENYDSDFESDELSKVPSGLVNQVVSLLSDEREDELKTLLKTTYSMDDESVSALSLCEYAVG
jgi:hypothetical protein